MISQGAPRETDSHHELLLSRIRQGDAGAWRSIELAFRQRLRELAAYALPAEIACRADASDIVQQTFADASRSFDTFLGSTLPELYVWLAAILNHNVSDAVREHLLAKRRTVRAESRLDDSSQCGPGWEGICAADQTSPSMAAARVETREQLHAALECLPPRQKQAVRMRHLEGCPLIDIAAALGCTADAAAAVIARGLRALRKDLGEPD